MSTMEMCPMASMCKGMANKPVSGILLMIPGIVLIVVGVMIVIEPRILVWLVAMASIVFGVMMLFFANFIRKMSAQFANMGK